MKVLCVSAGLDAAFGGPPTCAANSAIAAKRAGIDVTVVFPHAHLAAAYEEPAAQALLAAGVDTKAFSLTAGSRGSARAWGVSWGLARWLWRHVGDYDLIHTHSAWSMPSLVAVLVGKWVGRPVVLSPHSSITRFDMSHATHPVLRLAKQALSRLYRATLSGVVFASPLESHDSRDAAGSGIGTVIYHPVRDVRLHRRGDRPSKTLKLGFLGRLHPTKNLEALIEGLKEMPCGVSLTVAGGGDPEYERRMRALAEATVVADRIKWLGVVDAAGREAFLADIDVLVLPSHHENFGLAAAEAMASGVAVIVGKNTGIADLVSAHDAGLVVDSAAVSIEAAVRRAIADPDAVDLWAKNGRRAAREALSVAAHGDALVKYYGRIAA